MKDLADFARSFLCVMIIRLKFVRMRLRERMKNKTKNLLHILFLFVLIGVTFYILLKDQNMDEILVILRSAGMSFVFIAVFLGVSRIIGEAASLYMIFKSLKEKASFKQCFHYASVGFLFSGLTPSASGGQPAQLLYMKKDRHSLANASIGLVLLTVVYRATLVVFGICVLALAGSGIYRNLEKVEFWFVLGFCMNVFLCIMFLFVLLYGATFKKVVCVFITKLGELRIIKKSEETKQKALRVLAQYEEGADYIKGHKGMLAKLFGVNMIQRCFMFLVPFFVYLALGLEGESAVKIMLLQSVVAMCADMLPLPGGVFANEKCYMIIMEPIFKSMYVIPSMLLSRGISFYFLIVFCAVVVIAVDIYQMIRKHIK